MLARVLNLKVAFAALVAAAFAYGVYEARSYGFLAKIFPLYISLVMLILAVINVFMELRVTLRPEEGGKKTSFVDLDSDWNIPLGEVWRRFLIFFGLLLALYGGIWLAGYALSITVFVVLFYRFITGVRWPWALAAGAAGLAFIRIVARLLVIDWPAGLIQEWVRLPWPFN